MNARRFMVAPQSRLSYHVSELSDLFCVTAKLAAGAREGSISTELDGSRYIRFPPDSDRTADIAGGPVRANKRHPAPLFDHLIGCGEQFVWDGDSERLGGLEVDDEVGFGRLLDRQIGGSLALEDSASVLAR